MPCPRWSGAHRPYNECNDRLGRGERSLEGQEEVRREPRWTPRELDSPEAVSLEEEEESVRFADRIIREEVDMDLTVAI